MERIQLSDIFIGNFNRTQGWAARPHIYKRWGMAGHNGYDFILPTGTQIINPAKGIVIKIAIEKGGFGKYIKVLHEQNGIWFVTVYAHLLKPLVKVGQKVIKHQLLAYSDDTGFSSAPHVHFGIYFSDKRGNKIVKNRYGGYHNPGDKERIEWKIEDPKEPAKADPKFIGRMVSVAGKTWEEVITKARNSDEIAKISIKSPADAIKVKEELRNEKEEVERLRQVIKESKETQNLNLEASKLREKEKDLKHQRFLADLAEPLGNDIKQDEIEILAEIKRLVGIDELLEKKTNMYDKVKKNKNSKVAELDRVYESTTNAVGYTVTSETGFKRALKTLTREKDFKRQPIIIFKEKYGVKLGAFIGKVISGIINKLRRNKKN